MLLTLVLFILHSVDFANLSLSAAAQRAPFMLLIGAVLHAGVVSTLLSGTRESGPRLALILFAFFFGVTTLLGILDGIFLPSVHDLRPVTDTLINGGVVAVVVTGLGMSAFDKWSAADGAEMSWVGGMAWGQVIPALLMLGVAWVILHVFGSRVIFAQAAASLAPEGLSSVALTPLDPASLIFLAVRGLIWALLALPMVRTLQGSRSQVALLTGLFFAMLLAAPLLLAADLAAPLQTARLIEIIVTSTLFGWLVGWVLHRPDDN